jgi:hypothetical protein
MPVENHGGDGPRRIETMVRAEWNSERWFFYEHGPGAWRWDRVGHAGELLLQSGQTFDSRAACVLDAKAHGYGPTALAP